MSSGKQADRIGQGRAEAFEFGVEGCSLSVGFVRLFRPSTEARH